jgi:ADP-ribosylglycohydrolase/fructose-1,6-bisphosphatase/inositol monophosphatase family enzyme
MKRGPESSYGLELEVAVAAAKRAGELLRKEFHRKGGPRGSGGHAVVDEEAESVIQRILSEAFPDYGYLGEEFGRTGPARNSLKHLWLVDPNDGTSTFLKGFRGTAVSIALLRNGQPVLGVVFAYCAPDDNGDLFSWAEGVDSLRRNGRECRRRWPERAAADFTVLVSQHADRNPIGNAMAVFPMRYRAVPSIAYRLALVAAGEGDVAVSLNGPVGWDYAAGHALIRGAGADLYDSDGVPVQYQENGSSSCGGRCFGGPHGLVRELAGRQWDLVFQRPQERPEPYRLCWPVKGRTVSDAGILARAQGCLLGQIAGDSLGGLVEFRGPTQIAERYPDGPRLLEDGGHWSILAGQPTDDSEMALALARSMLEEGTYKQKSVARAYAYWFASAPFDYGGTTKRALGPAVEASRTGGSAAQAAKKSANTRSQANGALMRVSPLGIAGPATPRETLENWARADAALTHPHRVCQEANVLFTLAVSSAISSGMRAEDVYSHTLETAKQSDIDPILFQALVSAKNIPPNEYSCEKMGWVLIAFQNAFYQLVNARSLEAGVVDTVRRGGDTDTNAAIAGALLGAVHGREAIPAQWRDRILTCRPLAGLENVKWPRPQAFWPVDSLWLAELLLTLGEESSD